MTLRDSIIHSGSKRVSKSAVHVCGLQIVGKTEEFKNKNFHFPGSRRDNIFFKMKFEKDNVLVSKGIKTLVPRNETKKKTKALRRSISLLNHANAMPYDKKMSF